MNRSTDITGYHCYWNRPRTSPFHTFEILLTIVSAVTYKRDIGPIKCFLCDDAYQYFERLDILQFYDDIEMLDESLLNECDSSLYFAAGKIVAQLQAEEDECIFIDQDLVATHFAIQDWKTVTDVGCFHRETNDAYPWLDHWQYEGEVNNALPINAAFTYWKNKSLRREYAGRALRFMMNNTNQEKDVDANTMIITAEQKILGMFLEEKEITPKYLIQDVWQTIWDKEKFIDYDGSNYESIKHHFTHLWGAKKTLASQPDAAAHFSMILLDYLDALGINTDRVLQKFNNI